MKILITGTYTTFRKTFGKVS